MPASCEAAARLLFDIALVESGFTLPEPVRFADSLQPLLIFGLSGGFADQQRQQHL